MRESLIPHDSTPAIELALEHACWTILEDDFEALCSYQDENAERYQKLCEADKNSY